MKSDIKLDGGYVILEGVWTKLTTFDLMLDAPSRRRNSYGLRRALVHDFQDALTINYNKDYPGGVRIHGDVVFGSENSSEKVTIQGSGLHVMGPIETTDIMITQSSGTSSKPWATYNPINLNNPAELTVQTGNLTLAPKSLVKTLEDMQKEIDDLKSRISSLERRRS